MSDEQKMEQDLEELRGIKAAYEERLRERRAELANATNLTVGQNNPVPSFYENSNNQYKL